MVHVDNSNKLSNDALLERVGILEKRLIKVEALLQLEWVGDEQKKLVPDQIEPTYSAETTESKIVEYGLAWIGSIVFFLGIIFLMSYLTEIGYPSISRIVAYGATIILLGITYVLKKSFPIISNVMNIVGVILLFYITASLHFFVETPMVNSIGITIILLILITLFQLYTAWNKNSERRAGLTILFIIAMAILVNGATTSLSFMLAASITAFILFYYKTWWRLQIFSILIVYIAQLNWLVSNPIMGNKFSLIEDPGVSVYFLLAYAFVFILSIFISKEKIKSNSILVSITVWNALGFSILMMIMVPSFFANSYITLFSGIAIFCLSFSVFLKIKNIRNFAPATYATFGFMAVSIAIYGLVGLPDAYFIYAIQSFMVVSMALWFRSKIIVVVNVFMFIFILVAYFISSDSINSINFVLALTALATARILNWQKERLTLKTEVYRNIYLIIATIMLLYSFNQFLPTNYVTISWTIMASVFFLLSVRLNNLKYRYLSIFTIIITAGHLFFIDLGRMDVGYRVIAFIVFAVISLGLSIYYTKRIRNRD